MATKVNCWEFKKCERQSGGKLSGKLGPCPAATNQAVNGIHGGKSAGRACWAVAGSFCVGVVQGTEAQKQHNCWKCDFFHLVKTEEAPCPKGFSASLLGMKKILDKE